MCYGGKEWMTEQLWSSVERYISDTLVHPDAALDAALAASDAAGLPAINVSPNQGKLLQMLALMVGATRILEIGTLGGYSTIWMARALAPGGRLVTLEADRKHAELARRNIDGAGVGALVDIELGAALDTLPRLAGASRGPFDLIFIDADKVNTVPYFEWALTLSRPGSIIVVDNVVRKGAVVDAKSSDADVQGMRRLYDRLRSEPGVIATAIQTVGSKGYDGFAFAIVKA
jgi:predicted O-methyltransferase YrrM